MNAPSLPSSWSGRLVRSAGIDLAVRDYGGDGSDVLLLHGGGRSSEDWRLVAPLLTEAGLRVVAVDLRGYGRSGVSARGQPGRAHQPHRSVRRARRAGGARGAFDHAGLPGHVTG